VHIAYPYRIDGRGRSAATTDDEHIRQMIEQVLFTQPGERVNRPDFGSGLLQLVFAPASTELTTAVQFMVQGALQQWLGDVIQVEGVHVQNEDAILRVTVQYQVRGSQQSQQAVFQR
jgi:uncharacterized protein